MEDDKQVEQDRQRAEVFDALGIQKREKTAQFAQRRRHGIMEDVTTEQFKKVLINLI